MLTFGTSAFLKLVCLNDRRQKSQLRSRLRPSRGGYDYHRSLHLLAHRHFVGGESIASISASIDGIARASERESVRSGLERLGIWRARFAGEIEAYGPVTYEPPSGLFKVAYTPNFGIRVDGRGVAVHLWNTKQPPLVRGTVYAVLSLFEALYESTESIPDDLAVLSLRDGQLFRLSEAGPYANLGPGLVGRLETTLREVMEELELPGADEHPPAPQP